MSATTSKFRTQHVSEAPRGWKVRSKRSGAHVLRIAFPPGRRRTGKGQLVEVLHPAGENPCKMPNPAQLVIFGNPRRRHSKRNSSNGSNGHKASCSCPICKNMRKAGVEPNPKRAKGKRRNPGNDATETKQAVELYRTFQGKDPQAIVTRQRSAAMRTDYTALGPLLAVGCFTPGLKLPSPDRWDDYPHLKFEKDVILASNAGGTQLYAIGGNQDCASVLEAFPKVDATKDLVDLGEIAFVVYFARKAPSFQATEYMHAFEAPRPALGYDQVKREIFFVGGGYTVEAPGIVH